MANQKKIIVLAGPTAVGKTAAAIRLAQHFSTSIIAADSRQCYREMEIGVARPSVDELAMVPHYFIASHSIQSPVNAGTFEQYALQKLDEIFTENDVAIVVGGTGMYINALCHGIDKMPEIPIAVRESITATYNQKGLSWLQGEVKEKDPLFYATGEINNPHRMLRALEVILATGLSIETYKRKEPVQRRFEIIKTGLALPKEQLHLRISTRVEEMIKAGLLQELATLYPFRHLPALQTVGYAELFPVMDDQLSLKEAVELIKLHTRQYAKRQLTWFRKDTSYQWSSSYEEILNVVKKAM